MRFKCRPILQSQALEQRCIKLNLVRVYSFLFYLDIVFKLFILKILGANLQILKIHIDKYATSDNP